VQTVAHSNLDDYLYRSTDLEDLCVWEFVSYYKFTSYGKDNDAHFKPFEDEHPILSSFDNAGVTKKQRRQYPTLPWFNASSKAHGVGTEAFARAMCILFIPFRKASDILEQFPNFIDRHTNFKVGLNLAIEPISIMLNIEYNAANAIDAQQFKHDTDSSFPAVRALSADQIVSEDLADLQNQGWDRFEHHLPINDAERPFNQNQSSKEIVRDMERLITKENTRQEEQLIQQPQLNFNGSSTVQLPPISREAFNSFVQSLKTPGTCDDQWNIVKLLARHIWGLCFDPENTAPIRVMLHGEGYAAKIILTI
jgi:hypothetical protein